MQKILAIIYVALKMFIDVRDRARERRRWREREKCGC